jgi:hypothetical protein
MDENDLDDMRLEELIEEWTGYNPKSRAVEIGSTLKAGELQALLSELKGRREREAATCC